MKLSELKQRIVNAEESQDLDSKLLKPHATLIYGESKSGKTQLAATVAEMDYFERVIFFAPERGVADTLISMHEEGRLSEKALNKIEVIDIVDTRYTPNGFETCIKFLSMPKTRHRICEVHGVISCGECMKEKLPVIELAYSDLTPRDFIIFDSLSQIGDSAMNVIIRGKDITYKQQLDDYGGQGKMCRDFLGLVQAVEYCHIICVTHVDMFEDDLKKRKFYPLMGTSKMSPNVAKYFGTVIVMSVDGVKKKHTAASSTTFSALYQTGTRTHVSLEDAPTAELKYIYSGRLVPGEKYDLSEIKEVKASVVNKATNGTSVADKLAALRNKPN